MIQLKEKMGIWFQKFKTSGKKITATDVQEFFAEMEKVRLDTLTSHQAIVNQPKY